MSRLGFIAAPLPFAIGLLAALALASCGGEDDAQLLPGATAREITANLETVERQAAEGDCLGAEEAARQVGEQVEAVQGVEPELKRALERGATRLEEVVAGCEETFEPTLTPTVPDEEDEEAEKEEEEAEKEREKEEEEAQKEAEKEEEEAQKEAEEEAEEEESPEEVPPPHSEGKGKGPEEGGGEGPSGGIGPGDEVGGED